MTYKLFALLLFLIPIISIIYIEFQRQYYENEHGDGSYIHKNKFYGWIQMFYIILWFVSIYGLYYYNP